MAVLSAKTSSERSEVDCKRVLPRTLRVWDAANASASSPNGFMSQHYTSPSASSFVT